MLIFSNPDILGERELRASRTEAKYGTCAVIDQVDAEEDAGHVLLNWAIEQRDIRARSAGACQRRI